MIRPLTLYCTDGELRTRVWDFGGQHVLHAIMAEGAGFEPTDPAVGLSMISALRTKRFKAPCTFNDLIPG
jgi:hypothetical protein